MGARKTCPDENRRKIGKQHTHTHTHMRSSVGYQSKLAGCELSRSLHCNPDLQSSPNDGLHPQVQVRGLKDQLCPSEVQKAACGPDIGPRWSTASTFSPRPLAFAGLRRSCRSSRMEPSVRQTWESPKHGGSPWSSAYQGSDYFGSRLRAPDFGNFHIAFNQWFLNRAGCTKAWGVPGNLALLLLL